MFFDSSARSRFLDGLFSLFAREVVRCWATDDHSSYADLGKPILRQTGGARGSPLVGRYRDALVSFLSPKKEKLSEDSQRRLGDNPLRILDSKDPRDQALVHEAPRIARMLLEAGANPTDGESVFHAAEKNADKEAVTGLTSPAGVR